MSNGKCGPFGSCLTALLYSHTWILPKHRQPSCLSRAFTTYSKGNIKTLHYWPFEMGIGWSHVESTLKDPPMQKEYPCSCFRVTGPLCGEFTSPGEFPAQRPVTRSFDVLFDLRPNKRLSKQPWGWWFETPSWSLWRQCNVWCLHVSQFFPTGGFPVGYQGCFSALSVGDPFLSDTQPVQVNNLAHCTRRCVNRGNYYAGLRKNSVSGDKF